MNPFNLLINYIIANSRASFYNVSGNQEITNTALLTGMVSENPLMSYLIIDNKAKIEGENFSAAGAVTVPSGTAPTPGLPAPGTPVVTPPTDTGTPTNIPETPKGTPTEGNSSGNVVTLETVKNEIAISTQALKDEIAKSLEINKEELNKSIAEKIDTKIAFLEKSNTAINESILEIKKKLDEISKANQAPDTSVGTKDIPNQKTAVKNNPK